MLRNVLIVKVQNCTLLLHVFTFQLCTRSGMCLLLNGKIVQCEFHVFSFSFVHALVCANCKNDSCNILFKKKKKKKKDPYFGMGEKKSQSYATIPHYLSFLLGKGGNPYVSKLYIKKKKKNSVQVRFLPPQARKSF